MSSYATPQDFDHFGIRPIALPADVNTPEAKQAAIDAASAMADGYLGRFRLPLLEWGDDLRQAVCAIAAYELVAGQVGFNPETGHNGALEKRQMDALAWLRLVSEGKVIPPVVDSPPPALTVSRVYSSRPRGWSEL